MSLINQVLKDLDERQPLGNRPVRSMGQGVAGQDMPTTDWLRIVVWGLTVFLVFAYLIYIWMEEEGTYEDVSVVIPAQFVVVKPAVTDTPPAASTSSRVPDVSRAPVMTEKVEPAYLPIKLDEPEPVAEQAAPRMTPKKAAQKSVISVRPVEKPDAEKVREMIASGQLTEAENQLNRLLKDTPSDIQARELLIGLLLRSNRTAEAEQQITLARRFYPVRENLTLLLAKIRLEAGQPVEATALLEKQVSLNKAGEKTYAMLAPLYQQQGDYKKSIELYRRLVEKNRKNGQYWMGLAISLEALKDVTNAATAYRQALQTRNLPVRLSAYASERLQSLSNHQGASQ